MRRSRSATKSAATRSEKSFTRLWSVEKFDADASYHPMIVLSNLFRRAMQYMLWVFTAAIFQSLVWRQAQNVPDQAGLFVIFLDSKSQYWVAAYAVTKRKSAILTLCLTGRPLMAISWRATISAEKVTGCFR